MRGHGLSGLEYVLVLFLFSLTFRSVTVISGWSPSRAPSSPKSLPGPMRFSARSTMSAAKSTSRSEGSRLCRCVSRTGAGGERKIFEPEGRGRRAGPGGWGRRAGPGGRDRRAGPGGRGSSPRPRLSTGGRARLLIMPRQAGANTNRRHCKESNGSVKIFNKDFMKASLSLWYLCRVSETARVKAVRAAGCAARRGQQAGQQQQRHQRGPHVHHTTAAPCSK